jgi:hypothetical protein
MRQQQPKQYAEQTDPARPSGNLEEYDELVSRLQSIGIKLVNGTPTSPTDDQFKTNMLNLFSEGNRSASKVRNVENNTIQLELTKLEFDTIKNAVQSEYQRFGKYVYDPEIRNKFNPVFVSILRNMGKVERQLPKENH